ncbi:hypothetical protein [Klebsiella phage RothC]|uniref:Uncharacterized protein n=2 Tax=Viruses TaxID=10239 RepID=A0AB39BZY1_9CAUD
MHTKRSHPLERYPFRKEILEKICAFLNISQKKLRNLKVS